MKRNGPPFGSGPGPERKWAVGGLPFNRSGAGRATPPSSSTSTQKSTAPISPAAVSTRLVIVLEPRGRGRFDGSFDGTKIVTASRQAISDAARVLRQVGFPDDVLLVARHAGADHEAIRGPLGVWRKVRTREDRGRPRFVIWEPFPSRPVRQKKRNGAAGSARASPRFQSTRRATRRSRGPSSDVGHVAIGLTSGDISQPDGPFPTANRARTMHHAKA